MILIGAVRMLWVRALTRLREELGMEMIAESREQYLRYALALWENKADLDNDRQPARAIQALDVLCVIFDEV